MQSLHWYVNRLGRMSPSEVAYRLKQAARATQDRIVNAKGISVPEPQWQQASAMFVQRNPGLDPAVYVAQADRVLAGRYSIFDLEDIELGHPPQWNRDPLTGTVAPLQAASSLDYRDERIVGNIKYLWEPNRHLHIPVLAQAYALSGDTRYAAGLKLHIDSWIEQCPPGQGANWCSSLELGIRLINWSIAWQLIGGYGSALFSDPAGRAFRDRWMRSVYLQARAITRKLSRFSSANNHLIGETAGVYIASTTWACWPQMRAWGLECKEILSEEALVQNAPDGGNREQAFAYQQFVLDFLLLAGLAARAAGEDFPLDYWQRIEGMLEFLAAMMDVAGNVPMIGDADDGYVTALEPAQAATAPDPLARNYTSLLATGAALLSRADFARKVNVLDDKTRWLLSREELADFQKLASSKGPAIARRAFPQSGYYVLGSGFDTPDEIRMVVDAGPLGYLSIAAHGHADALSVTLNVGGCEVLIDPGTYAYHTEPQWRRYFRSTRAHNTVVIDGEDQSLQAGNFMWSRHANARCLHFGDKGNVQRFLGEHDGYRALQEPVGHQREIVFDPARRVFTIKDVLEGEGAHELCQHWHFSETLSPTVTDDEIRLETPQHVVRLVPHSPPAQVQVVRGGSADEGGWVSRRFGHKQPTTSVVWRNTGQARAILITYIYIEARKEF
jgi:hypothetical protein